MSAPEKYIEHIERWPYSDKSPVIYTYCGLIVDNGKASLWPLGTEENNGPAESDCPECYSLYVEDYPNKIKRIFG